MNRRRLLESAEKFDIKIDFDTEDPGVYDEISESFFTFEELLGDVISPSKSIDKKRINKNNENINE